MKYPGSYAPESQRLRYKAYQEEDMASLARQDNDMPDYHARTKKAKELREKAAALEAQGK